MSNKIKEGVTQGVEVLVMFEDWVHAVDANGVDVGYGIKPDLLGKTIQLENNDELARLIRAKRVILASDLVVTPQQLEAYRGELK